MGETWVRQQDKIVIWPVYFDSTKSRQEGRRVPKNLAVANPKILEIKEAADELRMNNELVSEAAHSKSPWAKCGMLLVKKTGSKEDTIAEIAKQLQKIRSAVHGR